VAWQRRAIYATIAPAADAAPAIGSH